MLASIIVVALKGMFLQVADFFQFKKKSCKDGLVWMITFLSVVILSIDVGLLIGVILSILCIFCNSLTANVCVLGNIPNTDLFLDIERFEKAEEVSRTKIIHYGGSINFATKASFKNRLCEKLQINLLKEMKHMNRIASGNEKGTKFVTNLGFDYLIIDFSALTTIDPSSVVMLTSVIKDFNKLKIRVSIAGCSCSIYEMLITTEFPFINILYPTISDAIHNLRD